MPIYTKYEGRELSIPLGLKNGFILLTKKNSFFSFHQNFSPSENLLSWYTWFFQIFLLGPTSIGILSGGTWKLLFRLNVQLGLALISWSYQCTFSLNKNTYQLIDCLPFPNCHWLSRLLSLIFFIRARASTNVGILVTVLHQQLLLGIKRLLSWAYQGANLVMKLKKLCAHLSFLAHMLR